ncbi:MAG: hypothetical protein ACEPOV_12045 [Hyphomicrobiales bacterium]
MNLPKLGSLQNLSNKEYRCSEASKLKKEYSSPACLFKLEMVKPGLYSIMNMKNQKYFQNTIKTMASAVKSDKQLWRFIDQGNGNCAIQNVYNNEYMTKHASQLSSKIGGAELWRVADREDKSLYPVYEESFYGGLKNKKTSEYRNDHAKQMSSSFKIPNCLYKMIKLGNGNYLLQNQDNYEYLQSSIGSMAKIFNSDKQEWILAKTDNAYTIQNVKNKEYMTNKASQLSSKVKGDGEKWTFPSISTERTEAWMKKYSYLIGSLPLSKICMPGSHDTGTFIQTYGTTWGTVRNTKTQIFDMQMQLMQGIRYFDIRPAYYKEEFHTVHCSNMGGSLGYQGAIGMSLSEAFLQLDAFLKQHSDELVILSFSHFMNWDNRNKDPKLTPEQQTKFLNLVKETLGDHLFCDGYSSLPKKIFNNIIKKGNVIALFNDIDIKESDSDIGFWKKSAFHSKGGYSNTNNLSKMISNNDPEHPGQLQKLQSHNREKETTPFMFLLSWQLTLQGIQNVAGKSILDLAAEANKALNPTLSEWMSNGIINENVYPNIINTDACYNEKTHAVGLSVEICKLINKLIPA